MKTAADRVDISFRQSKAFTLVELLVVIGIIALLISVLMPALSKARQQATKIKCMSNMRSIGQAMLFYVNNNRGSLPFGEYYLDGSNGVPNTQQYRWTSAVQAAMDSRASMFANEDLGNSKLGSKQIFHCPDVQNSERSQNTFWMEDVAYGCHPKLMPSRTATSTVKSPPYKMSQILDSSSIGMIFETSLVSNGDGTVSPLYNSVVMNRLDNLFPWGGAITDVAQLTTTAFQGGYTGFPVAADSSISVATFAPGHENMDDDQNGWGVRFRHIGNSQTNVLMADGHVESFRYNKGVAGDSTHSTDLLRKYVYVNPSH